MEVVWVRLPDIPVTVTVNPPLIAVLLAAKVKVLVPVVVDGVKKAFTPVGKPEAVKLTLPLKPFRGVIVMVLEPLEPCARLMLLGEAASAKLGGAFTVRVSAIELVRLPELPVMVTLIVPVVAVLLAESVKVLVVKALPGLKVAVTPAGRPDADKATVPLKPPNGVTEITLVVLAPCKRVTAVGEAASVKP
jgi:hypothetical protein